MVLRRPRKTLKTNKTPQPSAHGRRNLVLSLVFIREDFWIAREPREISTSNSTIRPKSSYLRREIRRSKCPQSAGSLPYAVTDPKTGKKGPGDLFATFQTGNYDKASNQIWIYGVGQVATAPINMNLSIHGGGLLTGRYFAPGLVSAFSATRQ